MYDDPTFVIRGPGTTGTDYVAPFFEANTLKWLNVAWAAFNIYVFDDADETDPANAVATGTVPPMAQDRLGNSAERNWERTFDLATLDLEEGEEYFVRLQAVPGQDVPVVGASPATIWGAPSALSDAIEYAYVPATELVFPDVQPGAWYYEAVMYVYDNEVMVGDEAGTFRPDGTLTRAEMVTILYRLVGEPDASELDNPFNDVTDDQWWADQIKWAFDEEVAQGFPDGGFRPRDAVTMAQLAAFIYRWQDASDQKLEETVDHDWPDAFPADFWAADYIASLTAQGLFQDLPGAEFGANTPAPRAAVASVLFRWLSELPPLED